MQEIVENNIRIILIEYAQGRESIMHYRPQDGRAKWFRDDLDQLWVKFTFADEHHVVPASRVIEVVYNRRPS